MRMRMQRGNCRKNDKETIGERPKVLSMVLFVLAKISSLLPKSLILPNPGLCQKEVNVDYICKWCSCSLLTLNSTRPFHPCCSVPPSPASAAAAPFVSAAAARLDFECSAAAAAAADAAPRRLWQPGLIRG